MSIARLIFVVLTVGIIIPACFFVYTILFGDAQIDIAQLGFLLWSFAPYLVLGGLAYLAKQRPGFLYAVLATSIILLIFAGYLYVDLVFVHLDAQNGIALLLFLPLYQLAVVFLLAIALGVLWWYG